MAESQPVDAPPPTADSESETEEQGLDGATAAGESATGDTGKKKKRFRRKKGKEKAEESSDSGKPAGKMSDSSIKTLLDMNPALKGELSKLSPSQAQEALKKMDVSQLLTGLTLNSKNQKDMASYKFWQTQPVPRFDEKPDSENPQPDGPIKEVVPELVPKESAPLPEGYKWVELDLTAEDEIKEVYELLTYHYVEDDNAMFRFNYSKSFLNWALKSPDWKKSWHIGVRAQGPSQKLVASIFGIPTKLRIRDNILDVVEINFLCIHKKLRSKRLTPVLIKEITRRCHLVGIYQAIYTAGVLLPTPVGSCRYFHRSLDWLKLYEVGFSPLPPNSTKQRMIQRNKLPETTSTTGWREMQEKDIDAVHDLLSRFLKRFQLAQELTRAEIEHWFIDRTSKPEDRVVWAFVVEKDDKITDFASFYCLESSVIGEASKKHENIRAAYSFYYASEEVFNKGEKGFKDRLQGLIADLLVEAKNVSHPFPITHTSIANVM
jgi:glycylpeptide N-tetradecanoyltransferase